MMRGDGILVYLGWFATTSKEVKFEWSDLCEKVVQTLKRRLTSVPILIVPEKGQRYIMFCDASKDGLGCVLMQFGG